MRVTEKLKKYKYNCQPGEYDADVYVDMSIMQESGLGFNTLPVAIAILDKYCNIEFNELDVSLTAKDIDRNEIPVALNELQQKGFIE